MYAVVCTCPPVGNAIVTPRHLFFKVHLNLDGTSGSINLSGKDVFNVESFELPGAGNSISGLNASAHVFVGGVPVSLKDKPWTLWANRGFAGCIMVSRFSTLSTSLIFSI